MKAVLYRMGKRLFLVEAGRLFRVFERMNGGYMDSTYRDITPIKIVDVKGSHEIPFGKRRIIKVSAYARRRI